MTFRTIGDVANSIVRKLETHNVDNSVPKLDWRSVINAGPDTPVETIAALDDYFSHFVAVEITDNKIQSQKCVGCEKDLTGFFGTWRWAIAQGSGQCGHCGWPSNGHHFIRDADGNEIVTLRNFILQIHPDFVEKRARSA